MIKEILFNKYPPIGYTDFNAIYISNRLNEEERHVVRVHESGHIWLSHLTRYNNYAKQDASISKELWNVACDMEIAYNLYSDEHERVIEAPRSMIRGGILKKDCHKFPNCKYAEDFYKELKKDINIKQISVHPIQLQAMDNTENVNGDIDMDSLVQCSQDKVAELDSNRQEIRTAKKIKETIKREYNPTPSLASEIQKAVSNRKKAIRINSYKRPCRRENADFIKRGKQTSYMLPLVHIYIDRSGSFDKSKTEKATLKLKEILIKYRANIKNDVFFFNDSVTQIDPEIGMGGTNYKMVIEHINTHIPELSIIVTDDDPINFNDKYKVNAIVIRIGANATKLATALQCKEFT